MHVFHTQGVQTENGNVKVDEFQNTSVKGIYALGDVCGKALLTPGKHCLWNYLLSFRLLYGQVVADPSACDVGFLNFTRSGTVEALQK